MRGLRRIGLAISAALVIGAGTSMASPPSESAVPTDATAEPVSETYPFTFTPVSFTADPQQPTVIGAASAMLSLRDGVLWFSSVGAGYNPPAGLVLAADPSPPVIRNVGGDLDLTGFPPGNVRLTVAIDDSVVNGGYLIPADQWQAVALAVDLPGQPDATPVFGQANWPASFMAPSVAADRRSVTWIDTETDQNVYEYSLALDGPNGRIVIDPKIKPGGSTNR